MKGAVVIQHLSVVNTSRGDFLVSRRGKKIRPNMENCGFSAESRENGGWSDICLPSGNAEVSPHTNWKLLNRYKRVCMFVMTHDFVMRPLMLIHTQTIQLSLMLAEAQDWRWKVEYSSLIFKKMMIYFSFAALTCWQNREMWFKTDPVSFSCFFFARIQ